MENRRRKCGMTDFFFLGYKITAEGDCSHEIRRWLLLGRNARQCIKKQRHHFADEGPCCWGYDFSNSHIQLWELDCKEGRAPKNWCFQTVILEKTLESPLDSKEIKPVVGKTDAEAEAPTLWPPDAKSWLIWKDPNAGNDWRQKEKRVTEYKMAGQHHWVNGHELGQTPGDSEGQGSLVCCSPWGHEDSDTTRWLNNKIVFLSGNCPQSKGTAYTKVTPIWKLINVGIKKSVPLVSILNIFEFQFLLHKYFAEVLFSMESQFNLFLNRILLLIFSFICCCWEHFSVISFHI